MPSLEMRRFQQTPPIGWVEGLLSVPVPLTVGTLYVAGAFLSNGRYCFDGAVHSAERVSGSLVGVATSESGNGTLVFGGALTFPDGSGDGVSYGIDLRFSEGAAAPIPPTFFWT